MRGRRDELAASYPITTTPLAPLHSRQNNFDLVRLIAAVLVVYGHSFAISPSEAFPDYFRELRLGGAHTVGLYAFFLISGFLITQSIERRPDPVYFARARILRLVPGLFFSSVVTLLLVAPLSAVPAMKMLSSPQSLQFALVNTSLLDVAYGRFPGVFETNPLGGVVNGSLWSIKWEIKCYLMIFCVMGAVLLESRFLKFLVYAVIVALVAMFPEPLWNTDRGTINHICVTYFLLGSLVYQGRNYMRLGWGLPVGALMANYLLQGHAPESVLLVLKTLTVASLVLALAFCTRRVKLPGDYSFGIYLFAFPIQQVVEAVAPNIDPYSAFLLSILAIVPMGVISWHAIEAPALRLKPASGSSGATWFLGGYALVVVGALAILRDELTWWKLAVIASVFFGMTVLARLKSTHLPSDGRRPQGSAPWSGLGGR